MLGERLSRYELKITPSHRTSVSARKPSGRSILHPSSTLFTPIRIKVFLTDLHDASHPDVAAAPDAPAVMRWPEEVVSERGRGRSEDESLAFSP